MTRVVLRGTERDAAALNGRGARELCACGHGRLHSSHAGGAEGVGSASDISVRVRP